MKGAMLEEQTTTAGIMSSDQATRRTMVAGRRRRRRQTAVVDSVDVDDGSNTSKSSQNHSRGSGYQMVSVVYEYRAMNSLASNPITKPFFFFAIRN